jgi:hypothetical protein
MIKIATIFQDIKYEGLDINYFKKLDDIEDISIYDYIIISGGDGTIRRAVNQLEKEDEIPNLILNPSGSFNLIAKKYKISKLNNILQKIKEKKSLKKINLDFYYLNNEIFLFSAGNMGDLQHIFFAENIRIGILKHTSLKYIISFILLLPSHILLTPFFLINKNRFFIFTPVSFIKKIGSFYGKINTTIEIDLNNNYNIVELDGDITILTDRYIKITPANSNIFIVVS